MFDDRQSIAERAETNGSGENYDAHEGFDEQEELFVVEGDRRVTLSSLYTRGTPVRYEFKLAGKAVKGTGDMGLIGFNDPDLTLIVPGRAGKVEIDPTYDGDGRVKEVAIRAHFKPVTVYDARSDAGRAALGMD